MIPSVLVIKLCVWFNWITVEKSQVGMTDKTGIAYFEICNICYLRDILFQSVMLDISKVEYPVSYALEIRSRQNRGMQKTVMQMHHVMGSLINLTRTTLNAVSLCSEIDLTGLESCINLLPKFLGNF